MYTVFATNHFGTVHFEQTYLEKKLAYDTFKIAIKCEDCKSATVMDALTGEILEEFYYTDRYSDF